MFRAIRGGLARHARRAAGDEEANTEPLQDMLEAMQDSNGAHTVDIASLRAAPRSKKPRVSFNTVTSATFVKDGDDPFKFSSPHERLLSPLPDDSCLAETSGDAINATEEGIATQTLFPIGLEHGSDGAPRQLNSGGSAILSPSVSVGMSEFQSPEGTHGEMSPDATGEIPDVSHLLLDDEMHNPHEVVPVSGEMLGEVASHGGDGLRLAEEDEMVDYNHNSWSTATRGRDSPTPLVDVTSSDMTGELGEVTNEVGDLARLTEEDEMQNPVRVSAAAASPAHSPGWNFSPRISPAPSDWNFYGKFKQNAGSDTRDLADFADLGVESAASEAFDTRDLADLGEESVGTTGDVSVEMQSASVFQPPPRSSHASSVGTQDTFDFEAVNRRFDDPTAVDTDGRKSVDSSPFRSAVFETNSSKGGNTNLQAPGLGLLASVGPPRTAEQIAVAATVRSPHASSGGLSTRSPQQDFAKWAHGTRDMPLGQSPQELSGPLHIAGTSTMHPIHQLTNGRPKNAGTRTRMGWEEFVNNCNLQLTHYDDQPPAPRMETSLLSTAPALLSCPRAQEIHEVLQQRRAEGMEQFVGEIAGVVEQKRNEYSVAKQMWDRSADIPAVASELIQLLPHTETMAHENFVTSMKDWHQHCKDEALLKWYTIKQGWLETDGEIVVAHTQDLRDEVQRLQATKRSCKAISSEIRGGSSRMQQMGELHDIKHVYQELGQDELRRMHEERQLIQRRVPEEQAALLAEQQSNSELEQRIQDMKRQIQSEEISSKEVRSADLQQQLRRALLEKQFYAHTCIIHKATPGAVCLQLRGDVKLWVEKATGQSPPFVRVSVQPPAHARHADPCLDISPELNSGLLGCAFSHILAKVSGDSIEKVLCSVFAGPDRRWEASVPCQELHRFLRLFDVAALHIASQLRAMRNLRKEVPEVARFSAQFDKSAKGDQPSSMLTVLLSVLRSHKVSADGGLTPLTTEAQAGEFNSVECVVKFNADLAALPHAIWSPSHVEPVLGLLDRKHLAQAAAGASHRAAAHLGLGETLKAVVQAMRSPLV